MIQSGPPGSVLLTGGGTGLYFMNVTLLRGDREPEPEPEPESDPEEMKNGEEISVVSHSFLLDNYEICVRPK